MGLTFGVFSNPYASQMVIKWWKNSDKTMVGQMIRVKDSLLIYPESYLIGAQGRHATSLFLVRPLNETHHSLNTALWSNAHPSKTHTFESLETWYMNHLAVVLFYDLIVYNENPEAFL